MCVTSPRSTSLVTGARKSESWASRVVLEAITVVHRHPGQNLVRLCVDISNLEACYLLRNYPIVFLGSREAGAALVMTAAVGDTNGRQCTPSVSFNSSALVPPRMITTDDIFPRFFFWRWWFV